MPRLCLPPAGPRWGGGRTESCSLQLAVEAGGLTPQKLTGLVSFPTIVAFEPSAPSLLSHLLTFGRGILLRVRNSLFSGLPSGRCRSVPQGGGASVQAEALAVTSPSDLSHLGLLWWPLSRHLCLRVGQKGRPWPWILGWAAGKLVWPG